MIRIKNYLKSPHPIGGVNPNQAIFSTLNRTEPVDSEDNTAVTSVQFSDHRYFNYLHLPDTDCSSNPNYPDTNMPFKVSADGRIGGANGKYVCFNDIVLPLSANAGGSEEDVGDSWVVLTNVPNIPTHTIVGRYTDGTGPMEALYPPIAREVLDVGWLPITSFNGEVTDQSTIELTEDLTSKLVHGMSLMIVTAGKTYYAKINSVTTENLTFYGALLLNDITELYYRGGTTRQLCINIPGVYGDEDNSELIVTDLKSCLKWTLPKSYIVQYMVYSDTCDSGEDKGFVTLMVNGNDVNSTPGGLCVEDSKTWYSTETDINSETNIVNPGDIIEVACLAGGNKDASDITVEVYFVTP